MTQALLNNLNTTSDVAYSQKCVNSDTISEFSSVLKQKTDTNNSGNKENIATEYNEATKDAAIEIGVDNTLENSDNNTESANDDNDNNDDPNITEEKDLTMEKELTPLENPAIAILLNPHEFKHPKSNNNTEISENSNEQTELNIQNKSFQDLTKFETTSSGKKLIETDLVDKKDLIKNSENRNLISDEVAEDLNIESIESSNGNQDAGGGEFMQGQSPQEYSMKAMINGELKTYDEFVIKTPQTNLTQEAITSNKIVEQISKQLEGMYNSSKVSIVLNPESLGKVGLHIISSKDGMSAQFIVENRDTLDLFMKGLNGLKESLLAHGINVDNVTVKMSETSDKESQFTWDEGSRGGNKEQNPDKQRKEKKEFEETMLDIKDGNV